jgi:hypothetical protein
MNATNATHATNATACDLPGGGGGVYNLTATLELQENTYDKGGVQELIVSDLRITNHGPDPVELRPSPSPNPSPGPSGGAGTVVGCAG